MRFSHHPEPGALTGLPAAGRAEPHPENQLIIRGYIIDNLRLPCVKSGAHFK